MIGGVGEDGRVTISTDTLGDWHAVDEKIRRYQRLIVRLVTEAGCDLGEGMSGVKGGTRLVDRGVTSRVRKARGVVRQECLRG